MMNFTIDKKQADLITKGLSYVMTENREKITKTNEAISEKRLAGKDTTKAYELLERVRKEQEETFKLYHAICEMCKKEI